MKEKNDWVEDLKKDIIDGVYDQYYLNEKRMIERIDSRVRNFMKDEEITSEFEKKMITWFNKYSGKSMYGGCNIWDGFISLVAEEGEILSENQTSYEVIGETKWRGYLLTQYVDRGEVVIEIRKEGKVIFRRH